jgi:hypothetical protein
MNTGFYPSFKDTSLYGAFLGIARGVVGFPLDQLFARIEVAQQCSGYSSRTAVKTIWGERGWRGFLEGATPRFGQIVFKQGYRTVIEDKIAQANQLVLPQSIQSTSLEPAIRGATVGLTETYLMVPLTRLTHIVMTRESNQSITSILTRNGPSLSQQIQSLFLGSQFLAMKQVLSWVTFLVAHQILTQKAQQWSRSENLSWQNRFGVSFGVGFVNTLVTWPLATLLVQIQKANAEVAFTSKRILPTLIHFGKTHPLPRMYQGASIRVLHCTIQAELYTRIKLALHEN